MSGLPEERIMQKIFSMKCPNCGKEIDNSTAYEYRGVLSCLDCFKDVVEQRDLERNEIIQESRHKTDRFKGLDFGDGVIGKANREILKPDIQIAKKESMRRKVYEGRE